jgi:hypothetical protein
MRKRGQANLRVAEFGVHAALGFTWLRQLMTAGGHYSPTQTLVPKVYSIWRFGITDVPDCHLVNRKGVFAVSPPTLLPPTRR